MVGYLSQSDASTGRVLSHTKSGRLFSLLGGAERREKIIVLPPRSTFRYPGISTDRRFDDLQSNRNGIGDILRLEDARTLRIPLHV